MRSSDSRRPTVHRPPAGMAASVLLLGLASGFFACGGGEPGAPAPQAASEAVAVSVETAAYRPVAGEVVATGTVEPSRRVRPGTKILGRVDAVLVAEGQRVTAGQLLARLESRDLRAAVRQAEAAAAAAEAQLDNARAQHGRMTELHARGSATAKNLEDATTALRTAEAAVEQAEAAAAAAGVTLGYAEVRSPFDGWLVAKEIEAGDMVQPGRLLFTLEDLDPVKVVAEVPEAQVRGFAPGDPARVEVPSVGHRAEGALERIVPSGDRQSRTFRFEVVLPNPDGLLKSGMFARVALPRETTREALMVPRTALVRRGQLVGLFVVVEGDGERPAARLRWVRLGEEADDDVEVLSGLAPGERYVTAPPAGLEDGAEVAP
ncbi:MAG TPA: efflux RND transporter periplasmic adaptor subunit [Thermoanaerobaculia bacterium]|nr:efflux RND transporter periplasmic adaptor subunit [Thermoanaerobaculia bacterium]